MNLKYAFAFVAFLFLTACSKNENDLIAVKDQKIQAGVAITFDDNYVDEWYDAAKVLEKYNWKATFFVSQFNTLSSKELNKLKILKDRGNEIGGHGWIHLKASPFEKNNGKASYLETEIFPMINSMNQKSFEIHSFAYPYGSRDSLTDTILLNEFNIIRGTTYGNEPPHLQRCYFDNKSRVLFGLGIDNNYAQYSIPYFISLLEYAKANNKVVVFYAHKPVLKSKSKYETEYKTLIAICKYIQDNDMKFYTVSDLYLKERNKK